MARSSKVPALAANIVRMFFSIENLQEDTVRLRYTDTEIRNGVSTKVLNSGAGTKPLFIFILPWVLLKIFIQFIICLGQIGTSSVSVRKCKIRLPEFCRVAHRL